MAEQPLAQWLVTIPARLGSERLPEKPLADLGGLPLVVRVMENLAPLAAAGACLAVATDSEKVREVVSRAGFRAVMTDPAHKSGTDRCAEAARQLPGRPWVLNVQGDEPFVRCADLKNLMNAMETRTDVDIGTLVYEDSDPQAAMDPNVVKAVTAEDDRALYFSRSVIPYRRGAGGPAPARFLRHIGVYAFRSEQLQKFVGLPPSALEDTEKLEQLRALSHNWKILCVRASALTRGIDTPEDLEAARAFFPGV